MKTRETRQCSTAEACSFLLDMSRRGYQVDVRYAADEVTVRAFGKSGRLKAERRRPLGEAPLALSDLYLALDISASEVRDHWE